MCFKCASCWTKESSSELLLVDEDAESFMPLPAPGIEFEPDLKNLVLAPVDQFKFGPDDQDGQGNITLHIEVAILSEVAFTPAAAAACPPAAAAAPSIVVDPPAFCGDLGPSDTGLETEFEGCEVDPADPEIQSDFEAPESASLDVDTRDLRARGFESEVDPTTNADLCVEGWSDAEQGHQVDTELQLHPESERSGDPHPSDHKDERSL